MHRIIKDNEHIYYILKEYPGAFKYISPQVEGATVIRNINELLNEDISKDTLMNASLVNRILDALEERGEL